MTLNGYLLSDSGRDRFTNICHIVKYLIFNCLSTVGKVKYIYNEKEHMSYFTNISSNDQCKNMK